MIRDHRAFDSDKPAAYDGQFNWDWLAPAFPRGIMPMDHDAVVQLPDPLNGRAVAVDHLHFLLFETKAPGADIPQGQRKTLIARALTGTDTVVVLWRKDDARPIEWHWLHKDSSKPGGLYVAPRRISSPAIIIDFVLTWATVADSHCDQSFLYEQLRNWEDSHQSSATILTDAQLRAAAIRDGRVADYVMGKYP